MCCGKGCCCTKSAVLFKLSLMGIFFTLVMMIVGIIPPFNMILVPIPLAWLLALFIFIPSITIYYEVKEQFWAEVQQAYDKEKASKGKP